MKEEIEKKDTKKREFVTFEEQIIFNGFLFFKISNKCAIEKFNGFFKIKKFLICLKRFSCG